MAVQDTKTWLILRRILECPGSSINHHGPPTAVINAPASTLISTGAFSREHAIEGVL
jgi:hypothetical protein